jgi:hypothetical protein
MAFKHGKLAAFKIDNASGVLTDITTNLVSIDLPETIDEAETTTLGTDYKKFIQGLSSSTIALEFVWDATLNTLLQSIKFKTGTFEYYPEGLTGVKFSGECFITSISRPASTGDALKTSVALRIDGEVTVA